MPLTLMEIGLSSKSPEVAQDSERQSGQKMKIHEKIKNNTFFRILPKRDAFTSI